MSATTVSVAALSLLLLSAVSVIPTATAAIALPCPVLPLWDATFCWTFWSLDLALDTYATVYELVTCDIIGGPVCGLVICDIIGCNIVTA